MSTRTALTLLAGSLALAYTAATPRAQTSGGAASARPRPTFEVASVRRCTEDFGPLERGGGGNFSPGRLTLNCQLVSGLLQMAYVMYPDGTLISDPNIVPRTPIEGGPGWIHSERYTLVATAAGEASRGVMNGPMLRALLEDRFKLRIRRESREVDIYALTIARGGSRLKPFQEGSCLPYVLPPSQSPFEPAAPAPAGQRYCRPDPTGGALDPAAQLKAIGSNPNRVIDFEAITLDRLAEMLSGRAGNLGRQVIDRTGLTGRFNIRLEFAPPPVDPSRPDVAALRAAVGEPTAPSLETALQEQLGLRLESAKGDGYRFVVESIERPSDN